MNFFKTLIASFLGSMGSYIIGSLIVFGIIAGSLSSMGEKPTKSISKGSILRIDLNRPIAERASNDPFAKLSGGENKMGLNNIVFALQQAKKDDRIAGLYLNLGFVSGGMATIESLREALLDFKSSKKFIYAYGEILSEKSYYLGSVADSVFLYPTGGMEWNGLNSNPMFFKGALDKLEIEPKIFRVGHFKSAVEPFFQTQMSDSNRVQTVTLLGDLWNYMIANIAQSRRLDKDTLDALAARFEIELAHTALKHKLVDALYYEDQVEDLMRTRTKIDKKDKLKYVKIGDYYQTVKEDKRESDNKIAVIYAVGNINSGKGDEESIGSESLVAEIRKARLDENVKAVVLRVNSPGGSALASDVIGREIELTKKVKKVVASFGDVAASGGYYISANCDKIIAQPNTITGSIGVFGLLMNTQKFFNNKLGLTFDRAYSNKDQYADLGDPNRPMTKFEENKIQTGVNKVYSDFINTVKRGRSGFADSAAVDAVAQGRVWSGVRAKQLKLVDELGGLNKALEIAAKDAGLGDQYEVVEYPESKSFVEKFFSSDAEASEGEDIQAAKRAVINEFLTPDQVYFYNMMRSMNDRNGVYMRSFVDYEIN